MPEDSNLDNNIFKNDYKYKDTIFILDIICIFLKK